MTLYQALEDSLRKQIDPAIVPREVDLWATPFVDLGLDSLTLFEWLWSVEDLVTRTDGQPVVIPDEAVRDLVTLNAVYDWLVKEGVDQVVKKA